MLSYVLNPTPIAGLLLSLLFSVSNALIFNSTALILAVDDISLDHGTYLLNGYGITYEGLKVPQTGITLPTLETSAGGNYGLFVIVAQVQYTGKSALTTDQWNTLYAYQLKYKIRMVHLNVVPSSEFGVEYVDACCGDGVEQNFTLVGDVQTKEFPTAGLRSVFPLTLSKAVDLDS